ncbi:MAG: uracil-DNA glycosylase [Acetobacteraceae bacterium]|nr:uracil-DNA glycosylase [Acetobacteraceae bacterium]
MDWATALAWQLAMGADEAVSEAPLERTRAAPVSPPVAAPAQQRAPAAAAPARREPPAASRARAAAEAAANLAELAEAIRAFDGLVIRETATRLVFADGVAGAPVMLVGEAPGAEEDAQGKPFVGRSGQLLDRMLASIGLSRAPDAGQIPLYITNIVTWRPPGNRNPTDEELALSLPFCLRHIALAGPRLLVLAGGVAAKALTGRAEGILRLRGRWYELPVPGLRAPVPALPMLHPAYLLRNPGAKRDAWADVLSLRQTIERAGIVPGAITASG